MLCPRPAAQDIHHLMAFPGFCIASRPNLALPQPTVATPEAMQNSTPMPPIDDRLPRFETCLVSGVPMARVLFAPDAVGAVAACVP